MQQRLRKTTEVTYPFSVFTLTILSPHKRLSGILPESLLHIIGKRSWCTAVPRYPQGQRIRSPCIPQQQVACHTDNFGVWWPWGDDRMDTKDMIITLHIASLQVQKCFKWRKRFVDSKAFTLFLLNACRIPCPGPPSCSGKYTALLPL